MNYEAYLQNYDDDDYDYHENSYHYGDHHGDYNYSYSEYYNDYNDTYDSSDYWRGRKIYSWILVAGVLPVCVLGLAANAVSVWAWSFTRKHIAVVTLFMCLGVADSVFLLFSAIRGGLFYKGQLPKHTERFLMPLLYLSQVVSMHLTLIIGVFRWLAVARPQHSQRMSRRHVALTCCGMGAWCVALTGALVGMELRYDVHETNYVILDVTVQVLGYVLPTLALLAFSVSLLVITIQHQRLQCKKKRTRTTMAVLSIAGCSFLASPVAVSCHLIGVVDSEFDKSQSQCNWTCVFSAFGAADLLQVLNASVNFFFYFFFASRFRPQLRQSFGFFERSLRKSPRKFSVTSGDLHVTSDSESVRTHSSVLQHQDSREGPTAEPAAEPMMREPPEQVEEVTTPV